MSKKFIVIVAGGVGSRMNSTLPKQFHLLGDRPVLMHTISRMQRADTEMHIIVVISENMKTYWEAQCEAFDFNTAHHIAFGGASRFQSVKNGIQYIKDHLITEQSLDNALIAVHDAARPLITSDLLHHLFAQAKLVGAVVPAVRSTNSIRMGTVEKNRVLDRDQVWQVQTPQIFNAKWIINAYKQEECESFTDDASVVEKMGNTISIVEGDHFNLKITHPEDLDIAQIYLDKVLNH